MADDLSRLRIGSSQQSPKAKEAIGSSTAPDTSQGIQVHQKLRKPDGRLRAEPMATQRQEGSSERVSGKGKEIKEEEELIRRKQA